MSPSEILLHLGEQNDELFGTVSPALFQSANFSFKSLQDMQRATDNEYAIPFYTRGNNPTVDLLAKKMAALEKAEAALCFGSGSAAIAAAVTANVQAGDHIVCVKDPYSWTNKLLNKHLSRFGVSSTMVEGSDLAHFEQAIQSNTKFLIAESPLSFTFELQDLEGIAKLCKEKGIVSLADNSYATPLNTNPIAMGFDMVAHSATKYLGGHSDAVGGILCGTEAMMRKVFYGEYMTFGAALSPFNAWLILRGLRTLNIRLKAIGESTQKIVAYLEKHPKVAKVHYPFSSSHPQHELAKSQMQIPTGQFSIQLASKKIEDIHAFCNAFKYVKLACSWGSYESLLFPAAAVHKTASREDGFPLNLMRFCIGLDETEALLEDFEGALASF